MNILITGSSGYIGTTLTKALLKESNVEKVIGVDVTPPRITHDKFIFYRLDCTKEISAPFEEQHIDTVVHLVFVLDMTHDSSRMKAINVESLERVLECMSRFNVKRLLVTSSATAYGAHADNPEWLSEEMPLKGNIDYQYAFDKTLVEEKLTDFQPNHPDIDVIIVRPAIVCGPNISNFIFRYITKPFVFLPKDSETEFQFVHEDDLVESLYVLLKEVNRGVFNIGPHNTIHPAKIARILKKRPVFLNTKLMKAITNIGWKLRLKSITEAPASMVDFIQYRWAVDGSRIEEQTSFRYHYTSEDAVVSLANTMKKR